MVADRIQRIPSYMNVQATQAGRPHYPILDGLRGTAALLVVVFHLMESVTPDQSANHLRHGYLAVDFFFALSGYVMGYAYDDGWKTRSLWSFVKVRLVRLHPTIIIGTVLGTAAYFLDPWFPGPHNPTLTAAIVAFIAGIVLIPSWTLPGRGTDYFPYNGVYWTLFFEYLANLAYALVLRFLSIGWLVALTVAAAAVLIWRAAFFDTIHLGYDWRTVDMAPVRLCYPFLIGLVLSRVSCDGFKIKLGWLSLSVVLALCFAAPYWWVNIPGFKANGLYDAAIVILVFPAIIALGAHARVGDKWALLCKQLGRISYPLYGTHYALVYVYADWIQATAPSRPLVIAVGAMTWVLAVAIAWGVTLLWDEPVRAALRRWIKPKAA